MITKLLNENSFTNLLFRSRLLDSRHENDSESMRIDVKSKNFERPYERIGLEGTSAIQFKNFKGNETNGGVSKTVRKKIVVGERKVKTLKFEKADHLKTNKLKRFVIVNEGVNGVSSVAEICRRERIDHETFLGWSKVLVKSRQDALNFKPEEKCTYDNNKAEIIANTNVEVFEYLENYIDFSDADGLIHSKENESVSSGNYAVFLEKINNVRYINKYFEKVNSNLDNGSIFAGCVETFSARKKRKSINKIPFLDNIYFGLEFVIKRILPKVSFTKKYYFDITKGTDRYLSKAEALGRLVSCGFKIIDFKSIEGLLYFVVLKESEPKFDMNPSYGPLYKMKRIGKDGKIIGVYKFRTMHPYSEYLQDYIVNSHGYADTGKPSKDFRIPVWGKIMRKFWLDEIPQLLNVLKGELKLVGIRPVSERYFQDIPKEMQKLRLSQKPGCIPPYVSLNREGNVMSVLNAEKEYLEDKVSNPYFTDTKYFFSALYNILFNHKRSA